MLPREQLDVITWGDVAYLCGGTNMGDDFPRCFNHFVIDDLGEININLGTRGGS